MLIRSVFEVENAIVAIVEMRTMPAIVKTKLVLIIAPVRVCFSNKVKG
jgi:hypothetical protein